MAPIDELRVHLARGVKRIQYRDSSEDVDDPDQEDLNDDLTDQDTVTDDTDEVEHEKDAEGEGDKSKKTQKGICPYT